MRVSAYRARMRRPRSYKGACRTADAPSNRPPFGRRHNESHHSFALPVNTPPPLVFFPSQDSFLAALSESTRLEHETEIVRLVELGLPPAVSIRAVATLFGYSPAFVGAIVRRPARYYRIFEIRTGTKVRAIQAPRVALKLIQQWIGGNIAAVLPYRETTFGFVPGRSHIDAAAAHCGSEWVYSVDIRDFFRTTTALMVVRALRAFNFSDASANLIAKLACIDDCLAQGAPSSPALSNLVFLPIDCHLGDYARQHGLTYTRYADDIVFSGRGGPPDDLRARIVGLIEAGGWRIAQEKEKLFQKPYRLKVHGLLVDGDSPRLTKGYRRRIRALRHLYEQGKVGERNLLKVKGHLNYADQVSAWSSDQFPDQEID